MKFGVVLLLLFSSVSALKLPVGRRAVLSGGLAALSLPSAAIAKSGNCIRYEKGKCLEEKPSVASGFKNALSQPRLTPEQIRDQIDIDIMQVLEAAYAAKDYKKVQSVYAPGATVVDARQKSIKPVFVRGDDTGSYFSTAAPLQRISIASAASDGDTTVGAALGAYVTYFVEGADGAKYRGNMHVSKPAGAESRWVADEDVFPLDDGRVVTSLVVPKRDIYGHVFMGLDPRKRLK